MAITIPFDLRREFKVRAPLAEVFELLADVPASASHFPKVDRLVDLGHGTYRWELQKVGTAQAHIQTVYASKYAADRRKGTVTWTPVPGVGNGQVGGSWTLSERGRATQVVLHIVGTLTVPLPALMKLVVVPVVTGENEKLIDKYIANLIARFGGEVSDRGP